MNHNDLDLAFTNLAISQPSYQAETRFHNAEIVVVENYTIDEVIYDADKGKIFLTLKEREDDVKTEAG